MHAVVETPWEILSNLPRDERRVRIAADRDLIDGMLRDGFAVRDALVPAPMLAELREACDRIEAQAGPPLASGGFGGLFVRRIVDRHPVFLDLARWEPLLSLSRALLGPQLQLHASVMRISYPRLASQSVEWHYHQRCVPRPLPPWFTRPHAIDHLIYLDGLDDDTGPLVVMPGSHGRDERLPSGDQGDKPGQAVVRCAPGGVVSCHASLWHRALAPEPTGPKRRMLIIAHSAVWVKPSDPVGGGCGEAWITASDAESLELAGRAGFY
jgi:hypothetical protein